MSTKSREVIFGSRTRGAKIRAEGARERARQAAREGRPRRGRSLVNPDGGLRWAGAAVADHRTMPEWRARLARCRMQSL